MRKTNLKFITYLVATVAALGALAGSARAQTVTPLFNFTDQLWSYYQVGIEPTNISGINWKTNTYNDSSWSTGFGTLSFESDTGNYPWGINTFLDRTNLNGQIISYYFRTHFNFPTNPTGVVLYMTNVVDDGCIVYLNGVEMYRIRMPAGTVNSNTPASGTGTEGARELQTLIDSPRLRQGDNVIAVELHDTAGSSDVDWTMGLAYRIMSPVVITRQPDSPVNVQVGDIVDLSVDVTGDDPRFWWFRNNVFLPNQTNSSIRLNNIQLSQAGTYHVVVSNIISGARSSNSIVNVVIDTFPPEFVAAVVMDRNPINDQSESNRLYVLFDEDVLRVNNRFPLLSATNVANYNIREASNPTNVVQVISALPSVGLKAVRLNLDRHLDCTREWLLTVSNLTDLRTNLMNPNPAFGIVGCVLKTNLILTTTNRAQNSSWEYTYAYEGSGMATNWYTRKYTNDGSAFWNFDPGPFADSFDCENTCFGLLGTGAGSACEGSVSGIQFGWPSWLFRSIFVMPSNAPTIGLLRLNYVIDDGAVFYMNDKELFRTNIADGPIDFNTMAMTCIEGTCRTNFYTLDNLEVGTNLFAVKLADCGEQTNFDIMFAMNLDLIWTNFPTQLPRIRIAKDLSPRRVRLNWEPWRGWRLQSSTTVTGGWANVAGVSTNVTGYTNTLPATGFRFYRLCRP